MMKHDYFILPPPAIPLKCYMKNVINKKVGNLNYVSLEIVFFFLRCAKNDTFLSAKLTARGQYVSLLHQAIRYKCVNIEIFCPVN